MPEKPDPHMSTNRETQDRDPDRARWALAVSALLSQPSITAAAKTCGVDESTLRRWLRKPKFLALYRNARRQVVEAAIARLQTVTAAAVATLEKNLSCKNPAVEIRAAATILDLALRGVELDDLVTRIEGLERKAAAGEVV
jgi:transposase-like protein